MSDPTVTTRILPRLTLEKVIQRGVATVKALPIMVGLKRFKD